DHLRAPGGAPGRRVHCGPGAGGGPARPRPAPRRPPPRHLVPRHPVPGRSASGHRLCHRPEPARPPATPQPAPPGPAPEPAGGPRPPAPAGRQQVGDRGADPARGVPRRGGGDRVVDGLTPWHAFYTSLLIALDAGDADLESGLVRQIAQTLIAIAGLALVPLITADVVNASVKVRMAKLMGYTWGGHVAVIGLGDLGTRVIRLLQELGHDVVAVDQSETSRGAQTARELDIPLVIGDASQGETLRRSSAHSCRALLALSTSDVINLTAALRAREMQPGLQVVLRLFDNDFAARVETAFGIPVSRSVAALAAPAFAGALLGQQVIGTVAVGRRVLVLAETRVEGGAKLAGRPLRWVDQPGAVRVIAHTAAAQASPTWLPAPDTPVRAGDRLLVVATRTGLAHVLAAARSA